MQLSDVLKKYTIKEISYHSKISEHNLEKVFAKDFESLKKVQTLGFISIIEREYKVDLSELQTEAVHYYAQNIPDKMKSSGIPSANRYQKEEKSRGFSIIIILLIGYASWYFFTQFDKKHLSELLPFIDEATIAKFVSSSEDNSSEVNTSVEPTLDIITVVEKAGMKKEAIETKVEMIVPAVVIPVEKAEVIATPIVTKVESNKTIESNISGQVEASSKQIVSIIPDNRLWFGLINTTTKKRDHFSVADAYILDVSTTTWIVATSSASFSLKSEKETEEFKDNKEHYFSISKDEIKSLSKSEYVALGGWDQW